MIRIGQQFAEERRSKKLTLEQVSKATKIREDFLRAIERGDFKSLPSPAYAHGFVRNYAKFLGLPVEKSLALFRREFDEKKNIDILPRGFTNPREYSSPKFKIGRSIILIVIISVIISIFLVFQYRSAIFNPDLSIDYPPEGIEVNSLTIEVKGKTEPDAMLFIDDEQVSVDNDGSFKKEITVFPGKTTITFKAENRFGKKSSETRTILVKPN